LRNQINGVRFVYENNVAVCYIDSFSDELKEIIKIHLASICHGQANAEELPHVYNYKSTLKEFIDRIEKKSQEIQKGMIGELLVHILILESFSNFQTISPYFNMEEKSIRKGFDGLLYDNSIQEIWITEVKAGELHKNKCSDDTTKDLLGSAYNDLKKRLNNQEITYWRQAINSARVVINDKKDYKAAVLAILAEEIELVVQGSAKGQDNNVIFVSILFENLKNCFNESTPKSFLNDKSKNKEFKNLIILSVQKGTYQKVIDFFKEEQK